MIRSNGRVLPGYPHPVYAARISATRYVERSFLKSDQLLTASPVCPVSLPLSLFMCATFCFWWLKELCVGLVDEASGICWVVVGCLGPPVGYAVDDDYYTGAKSSPWSPSFSGALFYLLAISSTWALHPWPERGREGVAWVEWIAMKEWIQWTVERKAWTPLAGTSVRCDYSITLQEVQQSERIVCTVFRIKFNYSSTRSASTSASLEPLLRTDIVAA